MNHKFLKSYIISNNKIIGIANNSDLLELSIDTPEIQRIVDDDNVQEIVNYQIKYYKQNKNFNFLGVVNIHYMREDNMYFLIDGQHRYKAIKILFDNGHCDIDIAVEIVEVDTYKELKNNYVLLNKNTQLPDFPEDINKSIPETVALYFKNKYPTMWSKTSRARRPHMYFSFFQEALGILTKNLELTDAEDLKNIVETHNDVVSNYKIDVFPDAKSLNVSCFNKCKQSGLFLGLFKYSHDDIGYKWVKTIIEHKSGNVMKIEKNKKKKIPKRIKDDSWDKYIGKQHGVAKCICCNTTEIQQKHFVGGHIISEKNDGLITVDNIVPISNQCNMSMATKNMKEFISEYYPKNLSNFNIKSYDTANKEKWLFNIF